MLSRGRAGGVAVAVALTLVLTGGLAKAVFEPIGTDFRISNVFTDGDTTRSPFEGPGVAYNASANNYLVVWTADGLTTDTEYEIFGQLVNADGTETGPDFRISTVATDGTTAQDAFRPDVAYNPAANNFLVVWSADQIADSQEEVYGQLITATGTETGTNDFRISNTSDVGAGHDVLYPGVAYNATANQYLVVWEGDGLAQLNREEIFGQRVSAAGVPDAQGDFQISNQSSGTDTEQDARHPAVACCSAAGEYMVVWDGDRLAGVGPEEHEIFGQRVEADGDQAGGDFQVSQVGTDGDANRNAFSAAVGYNLAANEYLVTWQADDDAVGLPDEEFEIFGQRVDAAGGLPGADDFRISSITAAGMFRSAADSAVIFNPAANEFLVVWWGAGLPTDGDYEVFGQRVSGGVESGPDFRITTTGVDGDTNRYAEFPDVAYNTAANEYLVGSVAANLPTDGEAEIFGRRIADVQPAAAGAAPPSNAFSIGKLKGKTLTLTVAGPGKVDVRDGAVARTPAAVSRKKKKKLKFSTARAAAAGTVKVKLKLTKSAAKTLREKRKVTVKAAITFTPTGGTANKKTKSLKVKKG